jgi:DNA sulfur modification protein DndC
MKIETLQFQPRAAVAPTDDLAVKLAAAEDAIYRLYKEGRPVFYGYSGGKDSAVITDIGLRAARRVKDEGGHPISVVSTAHTRVENPEIFAHYTNELNKMGRYARKHGLPLQTAIVEPTLASTWQLKILSGRGIPSFAGGKNDCTTDLKISAQVRFRKNLFTTWMKQGLPEPVTVLGIRREESVIRANRMKERGDSAIDPVRNKDGDLVLAPIANWSELDVFEHLGNITNGLSESYSDMKETDRI